MDNTFAKFGNLGLSSFDFIVRTDWHIDWQVRITEADDHYTDPTAVAVSTVIVIKTSYLSK